MKLVFLAALAGLAASIPLKEKLESDLAKLRKDVAAVQDTSALSSALSTGATYDHLENHAQMNSPGLFDSTFTSSGVSSLHHYYRGQIDGQDMDLILTATTGISGRKTYELVSRKFTESDAATSSGTVASLASFGGGNFYRSHCSVVEDGENGLRCTISGQRRRLVPVSKRGLKLMGAGTTTAVFWQYDYMRTLRIDDIVGSVSEFVHVYMSEMARALYDQAASPDAISRKYESARRGLSRSLKQYLADWETKKGDATADDKETLESLVHSIEDQYTSIGKWAKHMSEVYESSKDATPPSFDAGSVVRESTPAFEQLKISWRNEGPHNGEARVDASQLDPNSRALMNQGTSLIGKTMADQLMAHSSIDETGPYGMKLKHAHMTGKLSEYFGNLAQDAIMSSKVAKGGIYLAANLDKVLEETLQKGSDWFMGLVGLSKKNDRAVASVEDGALNPGEAQIAEAMFNAAAGKEADALEEKANKLKVTSTGFRFNPTVNYLAAAVGIRDPAVLLQSIDLGTGLSFTKGKTNVVFNVDVKLESPLDAENAKATVNVRLDGAHTTKAGSTVHAGVAVKAVVLGALKPQKEVEEVVVSTYIRYKNTRGFSTGFTGTLTVPLNDAANERTRFGSGTEVALRYDVAYRQGRHNFIAYADLVASERGDTTLGSGLRYEYRIKDDLSFFTSVQFNQNTDEGFSNRDSEAKAFVGLQWRF